MAARYIASIPFDRRLYGQDIAGSIAHARMLGRQGIITESEAEAIISALISIREEIDQGRFQFKVELEDVHMNIEARLIEKIGDVGGKLHTARSRNDQVALDLRLFCKEAIGETVRRLKELQAALLDVAETNIDVIMPGYTHLQRAQPVLLAHHLLAYFEMLQRDVLRFKDCLVRTDVMPLGSGALAGVPYPIDREFVAQQLGFSRISQNSIDAVSDRDFVIEYQAAASMAMMHLSRLAEELVLWSTEEFGYVFVIAVVCFQAGLIFYDCLLPEVSTDENRGGIGGIGVGVGYLGSLLAFAIGIVLLDGRSESAAVEDHVAVFRDIAIGFLVFALPASLFVRERPRVATPLSWRVAPSAFSQLASTAREARRYRGRLPFLVGRMFYADAANTLIVMVVLYATGALAMSKPDALRASEIARLVHSFRASRATRRASA